MCEVHVDFAFLVREDDPQRGAVPVLVVKERTSKMVMSAIVLRKTTGHICCEERDCVFARSRVPARDMVVKSDQESALRSIVEDVGRLKSHRWEWSIRHRVFARSEPEQWHDRRSDSICVWTGAGVAERLGGKMRSCDSV